MAPAVIPASPALRNAVIQCINKPAASPAVQQAAIQVFRLTPIPEEASLFIPCVLYYCLYYFSARLIYCINLFWSQSREVFMQVLLDSTSHMQKRIAAYLVLMKDPRPSELVLLVDALSNEEDLQVKNFVISHINNILTSAEPETQE